MLDIALPLLFLAAVVAIPVIGCGLIWINEL
jgi:hypothetical protein